jgi:hypothetical protein
MLSSQQLEQVRWCVLRHLDAAVTTRFGLSSALLLQAIRNEGFRQLDGPTLAGELQYLVDKKLIEEMPKTISPENPHWRITAHGRDFYAQQQA